MTSPTELAGQAIAQPPASGERRSRWHGHGWNRPISWELILRITPLLPAFLLVPLRHATTLLCFASMRRERAAARRNLARVTGLTGFPNLRLAYRLFYSFSRYMVAYAEMRKMTPQQARARLSGIEQTERALHEALAGGRGVLLATMHLGQWDMGLRLLAHVGRPVHVVMLSEEPAEVARYAEESRSWPHLVVHQMGDSPLLAVDLMSALRRNEIVAIQIDRPVGANVARVELFGAMTDLPAGPVHLAVATGAPVLPVFVLLEGRRRYRLLALPPMSFTRDRRDSSGSGLREAMEAMARMMESVIRLHPDQWFNFYDVWPGAPERIEPSARSTWSRLRELIFQRHTGSGRLGLAVGLGVFIGLTPFFGLHALIGAAAAVALRLNIAATVLATQITNPLFALALIPASAWLGHRLGGPAPAPGVAWYELGRSGFLESWLRGGLVLGLALGAACGVITWMVARHVRRRAPHA